MLKNYTIYIIRFLQITLCGVIPSAISVFIINRVPNFIIWYILCGVSFIIFLLVNLHFNKIIYAVAEYDVFEYIKINGIAYGAYTAMSVIIYMLSDPMLYSMTMANLRALEFLLNKTLYTFIACHLITILTFASVPIFMKTPPVNGTENIASYQNKPD